MTENPTEPLTDSIVCPTCGTPGARRSDLFCRACGAGAPPLTDRTEPLFAISDERLNQLASGVIGMSIREQQALIAEVRRARMREAQK